MDNNTTLLAAVLATKGFIKPADIETILTHVKENKIIRNTYFVEKQNTPYQIFFVVSGLLAVMDNHANGNEIIKYFAKPGQFCYNINSIHFNSASNFKIYALDNCTVLSLSLQEIVDFKTNIAGFNELVMHLNTHFLVSIVKMDEYKFMGDAMWRYKTFQQNHPELAQKISLSNMAKFLQITRPTLSRLRRITVKALPLVWVYCYTFFTNFDHVLLFS
jgi:CRP/FNR family transcriptional regulator, anaerobic regulatory protein